ncbi:MAG: N-acetyltransferase family protein [Actinomycetes bacterium]
MSAPAAEQPDAGTAGRPRVVAVDPRDEALFPAWSAVTTAVLRELRPDDDQPPLAEQRAAALAGLPERRPAELVELVLALDGRDRPVGAGRLELPQRDNTHVAYVELHVPADARRRGTGTALLEALAARGRAADRTLLMTELDESPELADRSPGRRFLTAHGFTCALEEVRRDLALPPDPARLAELHRACSPHAAEYDVVTWRDRCPDPLLEGRAELGRAMSTDVPLGDLDWQEETWDGERVRERERLLAEQGRTCVVAAAVHRPTGELVAFTELVARPAAPRQVQQWETMVRADHRGHRLGTLVKIEALRRLGEALPGARTVATGNAAGNTHMIAVNEALGFVPNGTVTEWQRPL